MADMSVQDALGIDQQKLPVLPPIVSSPVQAPVPNVFEQAVSQYPIIGRAGVVGVVTPKENAGYLEFYSPGETGDAESPRPKDIPLDRPGVEIYSGKTTPLDVLGDVTSHHLIHTDPTIKKYYSDFVGSLTPEQHAVLQDQYKWAIEKEGEKRPYEEWLQNSGLPGYFRGYAFKQWPDEFNAKAYTPEQRGMFDQMMHYLQTGK